MCLFCGRHLVRDTGNSTIWGLGSPKSRAHFDGFAGPLNWTILPSKPRKAAQEPKACEGPPPPTKIFGVSHSQRNTRTRARAAPKRTKTWASRGEKEGSTGNRSTVRPETSRDPCRSTQKIPLDLLVPHLEFRSRVNAFSACHTPQGTPHYLVHHATRFNNIKALPTQATNTSACFLVFCWAGASVSRPSCGMGWSRSAKMMGSGSQPPSGWRASATNDRLKTNRGVGCNPEGLGRLKVDVGFPQHRFGSRS